MLSMSYHTTLVGGDYRLLVVQKGYTCLFRKRMTTKLEDCNE
jgi:hypothetical protein